MKLLYGVQATGNGHISRSRLVVQALKARGADVAVILSGRDPAELWEMEVFEPFRSYTGLTFAIHNGKIDTLKTAKQLRLLRLFKDVREVPNEGYDLTISDFEPLTSRLAKRWGKPCLGIGHQYAFSSAIPKVSGHWGSRGIMSLFAPASIHIGLHWHHFNQPIFPPIVPQIQPGPQQEHHLIYLPFERQSFVIELLQRFPSVPFHFFTSVNQVTEAGNVTCFPFSREGFLTSLKSCRGIMANAGFELASEAIHLGKKILLKPLLGQYEQLCNAKAMEGLGWGLTTQSLTPESVAAYLESPSPSARPYPDVAGHLADWIMEGRKQPLAELSQQLWRSFSE
jgi:uncharacterized protein (TIGR00661 family)